VARILTEPAQAADSVKTFVATSASTVEVLLQWPAFAEAASINILRTTEAGGHNGLPLAELPGDQRAYRDGFALQPQRYHYTLQVFSDDAVLLEEHSLLVKPKPALTAFDAQLLGLESAESGRVVLPAHPLGSDRLGRDLLARLLQGGQVSLAIGFIGPLLFTLFGAVYGAIAASASSRVDNIMMRACDLIVALPFLLFMILLKVVLGGSFSGDGMWPIILALLLLSWPGTARLVRAEVLGLRSQAYIEAARMMGAGQWYLLRRHLLPNVLPVILVSFTFAVPAAIFTEAFLSFLGLGINAPATSWGTLCYEGMNDLVAHPHVLLLPSMLIAVTVLAFNLLGDALRDAMDVKLESSV
jgi:oligopeptide transport system permease protein